MKKNIFVVVALLVVTAAAGWAHDRKALRINEVLVDNETNIIDEYGKHSPWLEVFNANFAPIDISAVFLTNDPANPKKYPVPTGSELTHMGKRQHLVFFLDNNPDLGPLHTNFTLVPGQDNWIGIYDADGINLIDSITIPAAVLTDQSWARDEDGADTWNIRTASQKKTDYVTPGSANRIRESNPRIEAFAKNDENGFGMTVMAMCIVFSALLVLCLCFYFIGEIGKRAHLIKKAQATGMDLTQMDSTHHDSGEEIAAIAMALHEHMDTHDNESFILTVKKMKRAYSPWSSKIYSLRELPKRK